MLGFAVLLSLANFALAAPSSCLCKPMLLSGISHEDYRINSCSGVDESEYFSCTAPGNVSQESCCYENFGVIMQTQFWDYNKDARNNKRSEAANVFTIHGLWDDLCDGSYNQYCRPELEFADSDSLEDIIVNDFGRKDLYDVMSKYWVNTDDSNVKNGGSETLWEHEYNKHGTCFNTLRPECFSGDYKKHENAIAYFQKTVEVWETLPTYLFLENAGITPSADKPYALKDIEAALAHGHSGSKVYVGCRDGNLSEIWYYYHVKGNVLDGEYKPIDSLGETHCPKDVWYLPK
ncbi:hypothetical protein FT663_04932 [Candidozyma haemuli var. vulneris]|uniref:ribonuclease T2 n=1 Tax=Candidozyma haemuli TaxID=45357 RepID=A0A2V1AZL4_9ASCO|nr:hypothetical protein CXQ85_003029 [[Candida] haemuloni]KAF3986317.1 hypothetical protein FT663_04932 [[Candida] haemuloni var. vulneris]KAF3986979.1 hypothetical protein FT662_04258 [[Candida] haemuloni var. vulneris]PVH23295.1 hypothetical protein CXQ85_003029 [[Candida] haemuloni]